MALTPSEQKIYDRLQLRYLQARLSNSRRRAAIRSSPTLPIESSQEERIEQKQSDSQTMQMRRLTDAVNKAIENKPEINVTVKVPEPINPVPLKLETPITSSPKKWIFKHKYDIHGHLIETTATAE